MKQYHANITIAVNASSQEEADKLTNALIEKMKEAVVDDMLTINDWDSEAGCYELHIGEAYEAD